METFKVEQLRDSVAVQKTDASGGVSRWSMQGDQIEKHMRGIDDAAHPFKSVPRGELSAARDMANEYRKQRES